MAAISPVNENWVSALPGLAVFTKRSFNAGARSTTVRPDKRTFMPTYQPLADMASDFADYLSQFSADYMNDENYDYENSAYEYGYENPFSNAFLQ